MTFQCTSNPATPSNKNCFIPRTKHPNKSSTSSYTVQCSEESSDLLTGDSKHPLHKIWHNTDEQDKTELYIYSKGQRSLFWWCQSSHFGLRRKSVGEKSKRPSMLAVNDYRWAEMWAYDTGYQLPTTQSESPRHFNPHSQLVSCNLISSYNAGEEQCLTVV